MASSSVDVVAPAEEGKLISSDAILEELFNSMKQGEREDDSDGSREEASDLSDTDVEDNDSKRKRKHKRKKHKKHKKHKKSRHRSEERRSHEEEPAEANYRRQEEDRPHHREREHSKSRSKSQQDQSVAYDRDKEFSNTWPRSSHDYHGEDEHRSIRYVESDRRSHHYHEDSGERRSSDERFYRREERERDDPGNRRYHLDDRHDRRPVASPPRSHDRYYKDNREEHWHRRPNGTALQHRHGDDAAERRRPRQEPRPPVRRDEDVFWESTWEAMELQKKVDEHERRGKHFYGEEQRHRDNSKSRPSPNIKKVTERSPSPECEELKRLRKLKEIQDLVVKEEDKYVKEPPDPNLFEYDERTKLWRRKLTAKEEVAPSSYEQELRKKMEEHFREAREKTEAPAECDAAKDGSNSAADDTAEEEAVKAEETSGDAIENKDKQKPKKEKAKDLSKLSLDEIEELRRTKDDSSKESRRTERDSRQRNREDGEIVSDEERDRKGSRRRSPNASNRRRPRDRRSRSPDRSGFSRRGLHERDRRHDRRSPAPRRRHEGSRPRSRSRSRPRRRSRSRSRERNDGGFRGARADIDKAKLLAIAKKNAVRLLSSNNLMGMDHNRLIAIKSGGQSLGQLVDFCRELARKGITDEFSDDEEKLMGGSSDADERDYHHPFEVKDRPLPLPFSFGSAPGSSFGPSGLALENLTPHAKAAAKTHRMLEFPVSSGNAHRVKEVVVGEEVAEPMKAIEGPAISEETTASSEAAEPEAEKEQSETEKLNAANPLGVLMFGGFKQTSEPKEPASETKADDKDKDKVFEEVEQPAQDIGEIVSMRLNAMKKLSSNPHDPEALREMYNAQQQMSVWATSKNKPGQFTGHTGAKILSKGELSQGIQAWAKQEQFTQAKKVSGGFGEYMLRKMGWSEGEGLGKDRSGEVDPLTLDIKHDKKGLMAAEEELRRRKGRSDVLTLTGCKDMTGKHPVSALMELATKRRWGPPQFVQAFECGPSHKKQYIFKVVVNGVDYQPSIASDNKKKAKSDAATVALREFGLLPKDPNNPL